jgi:uncharacterized protein YcsI (UPF0317 family)
MMSLARAQSVREEPGKHEKYRNSTGREIRELCRAGLWEDSTAGMARNFYQANLVILPKEYAFEFMCFCHRNPKPCPLIDVTEPGNPEFARAAPGSDVRTDLPAYYVYREGELVEERTDIKNIWRDDHVGFITGCTFSADAVLEESEVEFGRIETASGRFGAYVTSIPCEPAGRLHGHMVVNARPVAAHSVARVVEITSRCPLAHGGPVHIGFPEQIGVDLTKPDWGQDRGTFGDYVPVFWGCGVTPAVVAQESRLPEMITHKVAHMFVTDFRI